MSFSRFFLPLGSLFVLAVACGSSDDEVATGPSHDDGGSDATVANDGGGNPDGSASSGEIRGLDPSFGSGGSVAFDLGRGEDSLATLAVQSSGAVVVAGRNARDTVAIAPGDLADLHVARFGTNGVLDATFGSGGKALFPVAGLAQPLAAVIQADGKIVVVGRTERLGVHGASFMVVRITKEGAFDPSFGSTGGIIADTPGIANAVAVQSDGKVVVAGENDHAMAIVRYNADGSRDAAFGTGGMVRVPTKSESRAASVAIGAGGSIVAAGNAVENPSGKYYGLVARVTSAGALDTTLNGTGQVLESAASGLYYINSMGELGPGGAITFAAGTSTNVADHFIARLTSAGQYDSSFGGGTGFVQSSGNLSHVLVAPDGKVAIPTTSGAVTQYTSAGALDTFGTGGTSAPALSFPLRAFGRGVDGSYFIGGQPDPGGVAVGHVSATGTVDGAYGTGGLASVASGASREEFLGVAVQGDGKILAGGVRPPERFVFARYDASGAADAAFGTNGRAEEVATESAIFLGPVSMPDGSFYVATGGFGNSNLRVFRYSATGLRDMSFNNGFALFQTGYVVPRAFTVDTMGRPVVGADASGFLVVRFTREGKLDGAFGTAGTARADFGTAGAEAVVALSDGRLLAAGANATSVNAIRFDDAGHPDPGFGTRGTLSFALPDVTVRRILALPGGAALIVGARTTAPSGVFVARITGSGALDGSFGNGGIVSTPGGIVGAEVSAVLQGDGLLVATDKSDDGLHRDMIFLRYTLTGALDTAFGTGGTMIVTVSKGNDVANAMTIDTEGRPIVAGRTWSPTTGADGLVFRLK